ncbi:MAG: type II toxin-antitoxin system VapC family toxin [Pseudomonadota bacterium]
MSWLVVDASVACKALVPEVHSSIAETLLAETEDIAAPDLIWVEIGSALVKRLWRNEIPIIQVSALMRDFRAVSFRIFPTEPLIDKAVALASNFRHRVYDCVYVALAVERECRLVTADRGFFNAFARSPLADRVMWIEDALA